MLRQSTELFFIKPDAASAREAKEKAKELEERILRTHEDLATNKGLLQTHQKACHRVTEFLTMVEASTTETERLDVAVARKLISTLLMIYLETKHNQRTPNQSTTENASSAESALQNIKYGALALLNKLCRLDERFRSILVTGLMVDQNGGPCRLGDLNLAEDIATGDNKAKMVVAEFGQTLIRAMGSASSADKLITIGDVFGSSEEARDLMHRLESTQMGELLKKLSSTHPAKPSASGPDGPTPPSSPGFYSDNSPLQSQGSDRRACISKRNIVFLDERDGGANAGDSTYQRLLCHTPSFASRGGQDFDELADVKARINDIESVCAQQSEMITLAVKDLYRFSREASDRAYRASERLVHQELEAFKAAEAVRRMKEQAVQERLAAAASASPGHQRSGSLGSRGLAPPRESSMQVADAKHEEKEKRSQEELPLHRRMVNLEKSIAFQTKESIDEMQKKMEKSVRLEISKSQKAMFQEIRTQLAAPQEAKGGQEDRIATAKPGHTHNEFSIDGAKRNLSGNIKPAPNQNLSINIQVGSNGSSQKMDQQVITQDSIAQLAQVKERVEVVYQHGVDQYEELRKKVYLLHQRVLEAEERGRDGPVPIMQVTDSHLTHQPVLVQQIGGSQFRKTAANSSLGVKNPRVRVLSPVVSYPKAAGERYPGQGGRPRVQPSATVGRAGQLKAISRDAIVSPLRSQHHRHTHSNFYNHPTGSSLE